MTDTTRASLNSFTSSKPVTGAQNWFLDHTTAEVLGVARTNWDYSIIHDEEWLGSTYFKEERENLFSVECHVRSIFNYSEDFLSNREAFIKYKIFEDREISPEKVLFLAFNSLSIDFNKDGLKRRLTHTVSKKQILDHIRAGTFGTDPGVSLRLYQRLNALKNMSLDPDEPAPTITTASIIGFAGFLSKFRPSLVPKLVLTDKGQVRATWRKGARKRVSVSFLGEENCAFSLAFPSGEEEIDRVAGYIKLEKLRSQLGAFDLENIFY